MVICFIQSKNRKVYLNNQIIYKKGYCNNRYLKLLIKLIIGIFEDYKPYWKFLRKVPLSFSFESDPPFLSKVTRLS